MRAYVLGAGASYPLYPLGGGLLQAINDFIRDYGPCFDRFDYQKDWPKTLSRLEMSSNPLLREAYRVGNIEQIFTILDFAKTLHDESLVSILRAGKKGSEQVAAAEASYEILSSEIDDYQHIRNVLLWAIEAFFLHKHQDDQARWKESEQGKNLRAFAEVLQPGDTVITFNYDSTVERALLEQKKWSPKDGYGTELVFQKARHDRTLIPFPPSTIKVLHLHGAIGWYRKPRIRMDYQLSGDGGAIPREALTPAPLDTEISLDPLVLQGFGIFCRDASMPDRPPDEYQILLHPSFLKDYTGEETGMEIFVRLWRAASQAIREAEEVTVVGYSLPSADSAAWTLLVTACDSKRTTIVNPDAATMSRYRKFLKLPVLRPAVTFETWLKSHHSAAPRPDSSAHGNPNPMALVSITRLRLRSWRFLPMFAWYVLRSARQAARAEGNLAAKLLRERRNTFWTSTLWTGEAAMKKFMTSGAHGKAMRKLVEWCDEAAVVHWTQDNAELPSWPEAYQRLQKDGRRSKVNHPSAGHLAYEFPPPPVNPRGDLKFK